MATEGGIFAAVSPPPQQPRWRTKIGLIFLACAACLALPAVIGQDGKTSFDMGYRRIQPPVRITATDGKSPVLAGTAQTPARGPAPLRPTRTSIPINGLIFASGSAVIRQTGALPVVARLVTSGQCDARPLLIVGYSDRHGSAAGKQKLSETRAEAVRTALIQMGVAPANLRAEGRADRDMLDPARTAAADARNRRVEITGCAGPG